MPVVMCRGCQKKIRVGAALLGKPFKCPNCARKMILAPPRKSAAAPPAASPQAPVRKKAAVPAGKTPAQAVGKRPPPAATKSVAARTPPQSVSRPAPPPTLKPQPPAQFPGRRPASTSTKEGGNALLYLLGGMGVLVLASVLFLLFSAPGRGDLKGNVTFQGKPVLVGTVTVQSKEGIKNSPLQDGQYAIKDVPAGPLKITVSSPAPLSQANLAPRGGKVDSPPPAAEPSKWFALPDKYASFQTSPLTFELRQGENEFAINLE